jgi:hypothetical protein
VAGNATIKLYDGKKFVTFELWVQSLNTATQNEFASQQIHDAMSWIPIRRAEMFFNFTALWPLVSVKSDLTLKQGYEGLDPRDGFAKLNRLQDAIRNHQLASVNNAINDPMVFTYFNNTNQSSPIFNKMISQKPMPSTIFAPIKGYIQTADKQYVRFQDYFTVNYTMNVLTTPTGSTYTTQMISGTAGVSYAPTAATVRNYGSNWINIGPLVSAANSIKIQPINNTNQTPTNNTPKGNYTTGNYVITNK